MSDGPKIVARTQKELAEYLKVHPITVMRWKKKGLIASPPYDVDHVRALIWDRDGRRQGPPGEGTQMKTDHGAKAWDALGAEEGDSGTYGEDDDIGMQGWTLRFRKEKALREQIARKREEEELLPRTEVIDGWVARYSEMRNTLFGVVPKLAALVYSAPSEAVAASIIREAFTEICGAFSRRLKIVPDGLEIDLDHIEPDDDARP